MESDHIDNQKIAASEDESTSNGNTDSTGMENICADTPWLEAGKMNSKKDICKDDDRTEGGTKSVQLDDKSAGVNGKIDDSKHTQGTNNDTAREMKDTMHPPSPTSSRSTVSTCEGWDIVESSGSDNSGNEELNRPKVCVLGKSASEMALSRKVNALKDESRKASERRRRALSSDSKAMKKKYERHRRRAYTSEKDLRNTEDRNVTNPLMNYVDVENINDVIPSVEITKVDSIEKIHSDESDHFEVDKFDPVVGKVNYDKQFHEAHDKTQEARDMLPTSPASTMSNVSTCESWDIVEDSESDNSENDEVKRPKFCVLGKSASEMALSRKVKYDAFKEESRKTSGDRHRSFTEESKSAARKYDDEQHRRRALTNEKDSDESNRRKAISEDYGSPQLQRPKFCSFGHSNVEMVLSKRAKYEADKEEHKLSTDKISQVSTEIDANDCIKTDYSPANNMEVSALSALVSGVADLALATSCNVKFECGEEAQEDGKAAMEEGDMETNSGVVEDDNDEPNDSDKPSLTRRRVMFGNVSDDDDDDEEDKSAGNGIKMNGRQRSSGRRKIAFDNGVDHSKMGDMLGEMGHYGERKGASKKIDSDLEPKPLFVQLNEHYICPLNEAASWKPRARWIKFEENWEEGADRWSKPHVASLTFNSLPQLRRGLENGLIMLDVMDTSLPNIFNHLVEGLVSMELIDPEHQGALLKMLHLYGTGYKSPVPRVSSNRRIHTGGLDDNFSNNASLSELQEVHVSIPENGHNQNANNSQHHPHHHLGGHHKDGIMKKIPEDAEGAMVMVAMEDSLNEPVAVLIRLENPPVLDNFLEAPIPLRFIFFLVGPDYSNVNYIELGRAMSTLFSDDIFRELAYKATDRKDLLNGINEFLNDTMVLPPGDWDRDLLLPITRQAKREQEKVMQRRKTISPLQMQADAEAILKMQQAFALEALKHTDPLERTGHLFGGLINDVKRRFPHYKSDFTDAFNFQCLAAFVFVYFACLSPAITFGGLLGKKTDNYMGVSEMIVSTSLCGMLFALLSGQPLVILGGTGPVLIFEEYLYKACKTTDIDFMSFRVWIGFWICILATIVVAFEGSILVRYFTRFTEEIFSTLISVIFVYEVYKGLEYIICANPVLPNYCLDSSLLNATKPTVAAYYYTPIYKVNYTTESQISYNGDGYDSKYEKYDCNSTYDKYAEKKDYGCHPSDNPQPNTALFAIILTFSTFFISFFLKIFRSSQFLGRTARRALANFGIAIAIFTIVTIAYSVNDILYTDKIKITDGFHPTDPCKRGWLINPMGQKKTMPVYAIFIAIVPAFLVFILLYMETLLIGMVVNKEGNKLHKGTGYHLDLFLIGVLSALAGVMGLPWMCAAPIRTVSHIGSLIVLTRTHAPGVKPKLDHIKDQRITNFAVSFLIGLSTLLAPVLRQVPIAALLGVFLYLGITSLSGLQFIERLKILFMPQKHHPDVRYIRMVKMWKMHAFTIIQIVCVIGLYLIKNSVIAMAFPFFLILLVILRRLLKYVFTESELEALDSEEEDEDEEVQVFDIDLG